MDRSLRFRRLCNPLVDDLIVIESGRREFVESEPRRSGRIGPGGNVQGVERQQHQLAEPNDTLARIAIGPAEISEWPQLLRSNAGLFEKLPARTGP